MKKKKKNMALPFLQQHLQTPKVLYPRCLILTINYNVKNQINTDIQEMQKCV